MLGVSRVLVTSRRLYSGAADDEELQEYGYRGIVSVEGGCDGPVGLQLFLATFSRWPQRRPRCSIAISRPGLRDEGAKEEGGQEESHKSIISVLGSCGWGGGCLVGV